MKLKGAFATLAFAIGVAFSALGALPSGYTELEWVEANGAQAIRTGYTPQFTDRIVMRFRLQEQLVTTYDGTAKKRVWSMPNRCFFCARVSNKETMTLFMLDNGRLRMDFNGGEKQASTYTPVPGDHVFEFDGNARTGKMDGQTIFSGYTARTGSVGARMMLFHSQRNGGTIANPCACRLYRFTIYDKNNNLKLDLVPVRDENATDIRNRYGVYDLVSNAFFSNDFTTGGGFGAGEKRSTVISWTGGAGDGKWSSSGNWTNATGAACVPTSGCSLEIPVSADTAMQNDIPSLQLGPVYFRNRGANVTLSGQSLILNGEPRWAAEGTVTMKLPLVFGGTARNGIVLSNMATNYVTETVSGTGGVSMSGYGSIVQFRKPVTIAGGTEINAGYVWVTNLTSFGTSTIYLNNDAAKHNAELMHAHAAGMWIQSDSFSTPFHVGPASGTLPASSYNHAYGAGYNVQLMRKNMVCTSRVTGEENALFSPRCAAYWASHDHSNAIRAQPVYYDGDWDLPNGNVFSFQFQGTGGSVGGFMLVRGAVHTKNLTYSPSGNGVDFLMNGGNAIGEIRMQNMQLMANGVANAFGGAVVRVEFNSQYNSSQIALGCADQTIDRIICTTYISDALASGTSIRVCSGGQIRSPVTGGDAKVVPAGFPRLVMRATGDSKIDYYFFNKVALVWWPTDPSYTLTCIKRVNETVGELVVSNGTFRIEQGATFSKSRFLEIAPGAAFCDATTTDFSLAGVTNLTVGAGGRFYTENTVMPFSGANLRIDFRGSGDTIGRLELADGIEMVPSGITTNGVKVAAGVYTGADGVIGATKVPWLGGACRVTVTSGAAAGVWTGLGPTYDIHEPMNWDVAGEVDLASGKFAGRFALSGNRADVGDAIAVNGFTFDFPSAAFTLHRSAALGEISVGTSGVTFPAPTTAKRVESDVPVKVAATQTWTLGPKATYVQRGGLKGLAGATFTLNCRGTYGGVWEIDARDDPGDFPGCFNIFVNEPTLILKGDDPVGKSTTTVPFFTTPTYGQVPWLPAGTSGIGAEKTGILSLGHASNNSHKQIQLTGTRITKQAQCYASCYQYAVTSMAGTTNEFAGVVKMEHSQRFWVENGSKLIFSGGLVGRFPSQGGGQFFFHHDGTGTTEVRTLPFYSPYGRFSPVAQAADWQKSHFRFAVSTNMICWLSPQWSDPMGNVDCDVPEVFAGKTQISLSKMGALDLHGNDQHIAALHDVASGAAIRSAEPATLYVNNVLNTTINAYDGVDPANGMMRGAFEGALSVVKTGDITLTLAGTNTSTGSLAVREGTVTFTKAGRWTSLGGLSVDGAGSRVEITAKDQIGRLPTLSLDHGGKMYIEAGVEVRVDSAGAIFYGKTAAGGTWGSSTSPAQHKDDTLFAGDGVVVVPFAGFYFFTE